MNELTKNQEKALREFLHEAVVPLIEDVLVKKLGQAMSYAKEQLDTSKRKWVGLTNEEVDAIRNNIFEKYKKALLVTRDVTSKNDYSAFNFYQAIEKKLRSKNDI